MSSGTAGAAGLASPWTAGLPASVPQPATSTAIGRKLRHKHSGIFPVRTAPAPTILFRKDGARPVPLAHEQFFDEVFSIPTLGPRAWSRSSARGALLSPECWGLPASAALPDAPTRSPNTTILTADGVPLEGLCEYKLPWGRGG